MITLRKYTILSKIPLENNQSTKEQYEKAIVEIKKELGWKVEPAY